jgi:dUTP pyrophosphatase
MLNVQRKHPDAKLPTRGSEKSAGYDLYSIEKVTILPGKQKMIRTGISVEMPDLKTPDKVMVGILKDRSSLSYKHQLRVGAGVIDQDYTGEIKVIIMNHGSAEYTINIGDKICQMLVREVFVGKVQEVVDLTATERGAGGFGSTGK